MPDKLTDPAEFADWLVLALIAALGLDCRQG